jgi:hypothetical protein
MSKFQVCKWRHGFLRHEVRRANAWRPIPHAACLPRGLPDAQTVRQFWAPILCRPPWNKFASPHEAQFSFDRCFACGIEPGILHRAHIVPRWNGGCDRAENLHLLCRMCHEMSEGLESISYWRWFQKQTFLAAVSYGGTMRVAAMYEGSGEEEQPAFDQLKPHDLIEFAMQYAVIGLAKEPLVCLWHPSAARRRAASFQSDAMVVKSAWHAPMTPTELAASLAES